MYLAVDLRLAYPPCDELGVLGAEVEDEYFLRMYVGHDPVDCPSVIFSLREALINYVSPSF